MPKVAVHCSHCGTEKLISPCEDDGRRHFCDQRCYSAWQSEHRRGPQSPTWKGGKAERVCEECGSTFLAAANRVRAGRARYCSTSCAAPHAKLSGAQHHAWKGGPVAVTCAECGAATEVTRAATREHERHFCSPACQAAWRSKHVRGANHPRAVARVTVACASCGKEKQVPRWRARQAKPHFCNSACQMQWSIATGRRASWKPRPKERTEVPCANCGATLHAKQSALKRSMTLFCGQKCHTAYRVKHGLSRGHNNGMWKGGISGARQTWDGQGGRKWKARCRLRDVYICQLCRREFGKTDRGLHVHHKLAWGDPRYVCLRLEPENGVCLCAECHKGKGGVHSVAGTPIREGYEQEALLALGHLLEERSEGASTECKHVA